MQQRCNDIRTCEATSRTRLPFALFMVKMLKRDSASLQMFHISEFRVVGVDLIYSACATLSFLFSAGLMTVACRFLCFLAPGVVGCLQATREFALGAWTPRHGRPCRKGSRVAKFVFKTPTRTSPTVFLAVHSEFLLVVQRESVFGDDTGNHLEKPHVRPFFRPLKHLNSR